MPSGTDRCGTNGDAGPSSGITSPNLIVDGDAEMNAEDSGLSAWSWTGGATESPYGAPYAPTLTDPGPPDRGNNLFIGGGESWFLQTIDVSEYATPIDAGSVTYTLDGWLGGYLGSNNYAKLIVTFRDSGGATLDTESIGPVLPADRQNATGLFERTKSCHVPQGARSVALVLELTGSDENSACADNLSLTFTGI